jgi:hypothetical protein
MKIELEEEELEEEVREEEVAEDLLKKLKMNKRLKKLNKNEINNI